MVAETLLLFWIGWSHFLLAIAADTLIGTVLTRVGLPGLMPLPWTQTFAIFAYATISCLVVNDAIKVVMIKWRVLNGVAKKPVNVTRQIAKRGYELYEHHGHREGHAAQKLGSGGAGDSEKRAP